MRDTSRNEIVDPRADRRVWRGPGDDHGMRGGLMAQREPPDVPPIDRGGQRAVETFLEQPGSIGVDVCLPGAGDRAPRPAGGVAALGAGPFARRHGRLQRSVPGRRSWSDAAGR